MANALKTLFTDIAVAIRNKTGEPETVRYKPAEFPAKILEIEVGGGGGGSLPAGVYCSLAGSKPYRKQGIPFIYKGVIHLLINTNDNTLMSICRLENGAFSEVKTFSTATMFSLGDTNVVVRGDVVHFIEKGYHYIWDGTSVTQKNNITPIPSTGGTSGSACSFMGELFYTTYKSHIIQVWDETTDTWSQFLTVGGNVTGISGTYYLRVYNNAIYYGSSSDVYRVVDDAGNLELVGNYRMTNRECMTDKGVYHQSNGILKLNGVNVGAMYDLGSPFLIEFNGELYGDSGVVKNAFAQIHIIEETE